VTSQINYPRQIDQNVRYRLELVKACLSDKSLLKDVQVLCSQDILFWIDCFCWTKDPRRVPDVLPFICYEAFQPEAIKAIETAIDAQEDILGEKSRDMGMSYMVLFVLLHKFLFEPGSDFRVGSRKEEFVDKPNDIDTLFEKLRFNLLRQPPFLLPHGFDWRKHSSHMRLINPVYGNAIIGESANEDFGSGGRRKAILLDEFAKWEPKIATSAWTATADVTGCRIPISTPKGSGNKFALLAKGTKEKIKKITLHWTLHPIKAKGSYYIDAGQKQMINTESDPKRAFLLWQKGIKVRSPWYDEESARRKEEDIGQELDIDYLKSGRPYFDLIELSKQKRWEEFTRNLPGDPVPYGKYFRCILVDVDQNKIEIRDNPSGWLKVFELPKRERQYVVGGDVSEGLPKGDESFAVVREKITRNVVATCNIVIDPDDFAVKLQKIGHFYNNADICPENNNHGYSVCSDLKQMDCKLYFLNFI